MDVSGRRFTAFRPFGSRMHLEHDVVFLAESWGWSRSETFGLPCSERFRYVKMKEELNRQQRVSAERAFKGRRPKGYRKY